RVKVHSNRNVAIKIKRLKAIFSFDFVILNDLAAGNAAASFPMAASLSRQVFAPFYSLKRRKA
ncbi:hypothetical protein, partial [Saccharibacillus sp. JS10]|uniref:hypothetical protein n=1 Tax=Saccharibacillus sp. JS10 TaxID=2950552 RepID=UPI00210D0904